MPGELRGRIGEMQKGYVTRKGHTHTRRLNYHLHCTGYRRLIRLSSPVECGSVILQRPVCYNFGGWGLSDAINLSHLYQRIAELCGTIAKGSKVPGKSGQ